MIQLVRDDIISPVCDNDCAAVYVTAHSELSFDVQPADTVAFVGQPAILHCLVNNQLHPDHIYWIKDGSAIQLDSRRSFSVSAQHMSNAFYFAVDLFPMQILIFQTADRRSSQVGLYQLSDPRSHTKT